MTQTHAQQIAIQTHAEISFQIYKYNLVLKIPLRMNHEFIFILLLAER